MEEGWKEEKKVVHVGGRRGRQREKERWREREIEERRKKEKRKGVNHRGQEGDAGRRKADGRGGGGDEVEIDARCSECWDDLERNEEKKKNSDTNRGIEE